MATNVDLGDIVRVVNKGDAAFTVAYDNRQYKLEPGKDTFIPFECAALWFGDPRSSNSIQSVRNPQGIVSFVPDRESETRRLRVKYGNVGGDERFVDPGPSVEMYSLEGERINTVLDDPEGDTVNVATPTVTDQNSLMEQVQRQQTQINFLLGQLGIAANGEQGVDASINGGDGTGEDGEGEGDGTEVGDDGLPPEDKTTP